MMINTPGKTPILINGVYAYLDKGTAIAYAMTSIVCFARMLSKKEFGLYAIANVIYILGVTFSDLSIGQALVHYGAGKKGRDFFKVVNNSFMLKAMLFVLLSAAISLLAPVISAVFKDNDLRSVVRLIPLLVFATLLFNTANQTLNAKERFNKMFYLDSCLLSSLIIGLIAVRRYGIFLDAFNAVLLLVIVRLVSSLLGLYLIRDIFVDSTFTIDLRIVKKLYTYAKASFANSMAVVVLSKADVLMLGLLLKPEYVATYVSGAVVLNLFMLLNEPINNIVLPAASKIHHQKDANLKQKIRRVYKYASLVCLAVSFPVSLSLLIFPQAILSTLYGGKYSDAVALVRLFAMCGLMLPFYRCGACIMNAVGRPQINAKYTWLAALINIAVNTILIYYLKTLGAALTSLVTACVLLIVYVRTLHRMFGILDFLPGLAKHYAKVDSESTAIKSA